MAQHLYRTQKNAKCKREQWSPAVSYVAGVLSTDYKTILRDMCKFIGTLPAIQLISTNTGGKHNQKGAFLGVMVLILSSFAIAAQSHFCVFMFVAFSFEKRGEESGSS